MTENKLDYKRMVNDALKEVVLHTLKSVADEGLPPGHHLYISFLTALPETKISAELKQQFPNEMTIVLQNQFWDLAVTNEGFSVTLNFNKIPHELVIPTKALTGFADPLAEFTLQFREEDSSGVFDEDATAEETKVAESEAKIEKVVDLDNFRKT
ncbi:MAG: ClpXP protease specificity-enhancing factor SspB [Pseudomonadota bacterium]|nr:ClpXP protease specificity-enhancing factor SspB [Pseudomonadota bacterium]